jgi:hypothetical protein
MPGNIITKDLQDWLANQEGDVGVADDQLHQLDAVQMLHQKCGLLPKKMSSYYIMWKTS